MPKRLLRTLPLLLLVLPAARLGATVAITPDIVLKERDHKNTGDDIAECIEAYVERDGRREAEEDLRETLEKKWRRAADGVDPLSLTEDLEAALYYSRDYGKVRGVRKGRVEEFELEVPFYGDYTTTYELWAPSRYRDAEGPYPVIFALPGGSNTPAEHIEKRWNSSEVRENAIVVALTMPENEDNWATSGTREDPKNAGGMGLLLSVFADVRDRYAIDHDRVYLVGEGSGGVDAAMRIANAFPDRFAGVAGIAGDAAEIAPDNFYNLPVFLTGAGSRATAFAAAAEELGYENIQVVPEAGEAELWNWMQANPRISNPEKVVLLAGSPFPNKAYWIEVPPSDDTTVVKLVAEADRASNTIEIDAQNAASVTLFFNDLIVDLDQPVKVIVNGLESKDLIQRNFNSMMEQIYKGRSDPGKVYTGFKTYDIPAAEGEDSEQETVGAR